MGEESIPAVIEEVRETAVYAVEDSGVWFSGMNQHVPSLARRVGDNLAARGLVVGLSYEESGGVFLPVHGREEAVLNRGEAA